MKLNIERLIEMIVREVIVELSKIGVELDFSVNEKNSSFINNNKKKQQIIDMSGYKTPILTETMLESIDKDLNEIIIPRGTVFTPGARDIIKKRNLIISYN
jgi:hypothetical protein